MVRCENCRKTYRVRDNPEDLLLKPKIIGTLEDYPLEIKRLHRKNKHFCSFACLYQWSSEMKVYLESVEPW